MVPFRLFRFISCPVLADEIAIFVFSIGIIKYFVGQSLKIMNFGCISVWFGDESLHSKCQRFYIGMLLFSIVLYV